MLYSKNIVAFGSELETTKLWYENSLILWTFCELKHMLFTYHGISDTNLMCAGECLAILGLLAELSPYHMTLGYTSFILLLLVIFFHQPLPSDCHFHRSPLIFDESSFLLVPFYADITWHLLHLTKCTKTRSLVPPLLVD